LVNQPFSAPHKFLRVRGARPRISRDAGHHLSRDADHLVHCFQGVQFTLVCTELGKLHNVYYLLPIIFAHDRRSSSTFAIAEAAACHPLAAYSPSLRGISHRLFPLVDITPIWCYSLFIFSSLATPPYFSRSSATREANCSGVPPTGSCAASKSRWRTVGSTSTLPISAFRRAMMAGAVPRGTKAPCQAGSTSPMPASSNVG